MVEDHALRLRLELQLALAGVQPGELPQDLRYLNGLVLVYAVGEDGLADVCLAGEEKVVDNSNQLNGHSCDLIV